MGQRDQSPWMQWKTERQERRNGTPPKVEQAQRSGTFELCLEQLKSHWSDMEEYGGFQVWGCFCDTEANQCPALNH